MLKLKSTIGKNSLARTTHAAPRRAGVLEALPLKGKPALIKITVQIACLCACVCNPPGKWAEYMHHLV